MKLAIAQTKPFKGDISRNSTAHEKLILQAVEEGAGCIVFPELSLTGYEPELAKELAADWNDPAFQRFQQLSDTHRIIIAAGMPTKAGSDVRISLLLFQPGKLRQVYSKQFLHEDEFPYFVPGNEPVFLEWEDELIAPAICYESLLPEHAETAFQKGATIYLASVAKSANGVEKAYRHYPEIAGKYGMTVLMANCVGLCDNFESVGRSAVWDAKGNLVAQLDNKEGILVFDLKK